MSSICNSSSQLCNSSIFFQSYLWSKRTGKYLHHFLLPILQKSSARLHQPRRFQQEVGISISGATVGVTTVVVSLPKWQKQELFVCCCPVVLTLLLVFFSRRRSGAATVAATGVDMVAGAAAGVVPKRVLLNFYRHISK